MTQTKRVTDMTEGSPLNHIFLFTMPLLVGNLFQQFYNVVDSIVVGNYVGADALAAVGTCGSLGFLFFSLSSGLAVGIGILASQYFGARDDLRIRATISNAAYILLAAGTGVSLLGYLGAPLFLRLLQVPEEIFPLSLTYLRITSLGTVAVALYNGVASLLRSLGDSKSPLYFLILSCAMNIVLDLVFVLLLNWSVFGVALATVISQVFSFLVSALYAWRRVSYFQLTRGEWKPRKAIISRCLKLGIPMALQSSLIAISVMVLQGVVNTFGQTVMAAYTVVGKIESLVQMPFTSLSTALTSFAGQNKGAGKIDRVKQGYRASCLIVLALSLLMIPFFWLLGSWAARCFVKEPEVIAIGAGALRIDCFFYFFLGMIYVPRGILNGCGDARFSLMNGVAEVACRILFASILTRVSAIGFWGIWLTQGLTWTVTGLVCIHRYRRGLWQHLTLVQ